MILMLLNLVEAESVREGKPLYKLDASISDGY